MGAGRGLGARGRGARGRRLHLLPGTCRGRRTATPPGSAAAVRLQCPLLTTQPLINLDGLSAEHSSRLSNRSLIAINHLPKQMSGTMGLERLEA